MYVSTKFHSGLLAKTISRVPTSKNSALFGSNDSKSPAYPTEDTLSPRRFGSGASYFNVTVLFVLEQTKWLTIPSFQCVLAFSFSCPSEMFHSNMVSFP